ncbi:MAG: hypothetical protein EYC62_08315 [Alphaproteobacteria bacterium]|nr:MAG: hypothetical protein EYC62_08315 [Alphaproteobacteria bacterium]
MTDSNVTDRVNSLEQKLQALSKRVEDLELDMDQPRHAPASIFSDAAIDTWKQKLIDYIQEKPLQAMGIAILGTAFLILLLK